MERTIYSKYSNERAARFAIRTDIVIDEAGKKRVCKYAQSGEAEAHIAHIADAYRKLTEAYAHDACAGDAGAGPDGGEAVCAEESRDGGMACGRRIRFCPCTIVRDDNEMTSVSHAEFPFIRGVTLQELLEQAAGAGDRERVTEILREYIRRVGSMGGELPFRVTEEFCEVFGEHAPAEGLMCPRTADIDLICSNILLTGCSAWEPEAGWEVIDYEWTFAFPVPKEFLLYRGLYFACYQILSDCGWSFRELCALAGIRDEAAAVYARMEEHFQEYIRTGALPVRAMQRTMGTKIVPLADLMRGNSFSLGQNRIVPESEWIKVRRIQYHIDREECQDGSVILSGWAFARTRDGRLLPVDIRVTDPGGAEIPAEVSRSERRDVAQALKLRKVTSPLWGFDCVWPAEAGRGSVVRFSLGRVEKSREVLP